MANTIARTASRGVRAVDSRLSQLDREWDLDRVRVEAQAASAAVTGLVLGFTNVRWFPQRFTKGLIDQGQRGWAPSDGLLRALGVRSTSEIDEERQALVQARGRCLAADAPRSTYQRTAWTPLAFDAAE